MICPGVLEQDIEKLQKQFDKLQDQVSGLVSSLLIKSISFAIASNIAASVADPTGVKSQVLAAALSAAEFIHQNYLNVEQPIKVAELAAEKLIMQVLAYKRRAEALRRCSDTIKNLDKLSKLNIPISNIPGYPPTLPKNSINLI